MFKTYFRAWVVGLITFLGGSYFLFESGFLHYVWEIDASKLSFAILATFLGVYMRLGYFLIKEEITVNDLDPGYEAADVLMALGMLGTVIGFIIMSSSFASVDFSNVENIKGLFALATEGMSTALYTTAFGLTFSLILRVAHYLVQRKVEQIGTEKRINAK